jgi:hypothetical protein
MANPFTLIVAGVTGAGTGGDLLSMPAPTATTTPYVDLSTLTISMSADGTGGTMSFVIREPKTPSGTTPWWRSGGVVDNARVQFFDSRTDTPTTPLFLGYVSGIDASMLSNGLGTTAKVSVSQATGWLQKTLVRNGVYSITKVDGTKSVTYKSYVDSFTLGTGTPDDTNATTDQAIIDLLLKKIWQQQSDSTTRQLLNTTIISGTTRGIYTGTAQKIGKQVFKASTLQSALDQVVEAAAGLAEVKYRYWIDGDGRLNYGVVTASPTYANAPAEIVTDPTSVQTGSASTVTRLLARDLSVNLDHSRIVKGIFIQADSDLAAYDSNLAYGSNPTNDPYYRTYDGKYFRQNVTNVARTGTSATITATAHGFAAGAVGRKARILLSSGPTGYTDLNGYWTITAVATNTITVTTSTSGTITSGAAVGTVSVQGAGSTSDGAGQTTRTGPLPQELFSAPKVSNTSSRNGTISQLTRATFVSRSKPMRSVSFTVAGGNLSQTSSPDWSYGYSQGWALTAAATYTLVKAWLPGQYVKINAPILDLASTVLYIPTVTMQFAEGGGTYQLQYTIQAEFRRQYLSGLRGLTQGD